MSFIVLSEVIVLISNCRSSLECVAQCHIHPSGNCEMIHWDPVNGLCKMGTLDPHHLEIDVDGIEIRALGPFEPGNNMSEVAFE